MADDWETINTDDLDLANAWDEEEDEALLIRKREEEALEEYKKEQLIKKEERKIEKSKPKVKEVEPEAPKELTPEDLKNIRDEEKRSDYEAAIDLFDVVERSSGKAKAVFKIDDTKSLGEFNPDTKEDFDKLASYIAGHVSKHYKNFHYRNFMKTLIKQCCNDITVDDMKEISSSVSVMMNDKIKESKSGSKKKKAPTKTNLKREVNEFDIEEDDFDDDVDFM